MLTIEQVNEDIPTIESFIARSCDFCIANDWYCTGYCEELLKAEKIPFEKIQAAYARHDGDMVKVHRYIKQFRL